MRITAILYVLFFLLFLISLNTVLNQYKLLLFLSFFIFQLLLNGVLFIIFVSSMFGMFFCIDWISVHWSWNLSPDVIANCLWDVSKLYIRICSPRRFVEGCGEASGCVLILVCFNWWIFLILNILQLIFQALFCLLLTCVYHIYYIIVHLSWNLSSGVISNYQWSLFKLDICIYFPHRFVEGREEGDGFCYFTYHRQ